MVRTNQFVKILKAEYTGKAQLINDIIKWMVMGNRRGAGILGEEKMS